MRAHGLDPEFPSDALAEAAAAAAALISSGGAAIRDLRKLLWCSIDNDDSRDLDQLTVAETQGDGIVTVLVAIADVDAVVGKGSPVDRHAAVNTTSVYTPAAIFPMLPERLSTDLTSLNDREDRLAIVIELAVAADGTLARSDLYRAVVRNRAKLAYNSVGAWLVGQGPLPPPAAVVAGMDQQLRIQDRVAQALSLKRHEHGALDFETLEVSTEFDGDTVRGLRPEAPNRAKSLIENLMVAANGATARFLDAAGLPSIRRVVREPARWQRIVAVAAQLGVTLPAAPDSLALAAFLAARKTAEPASFADLSRTIIKLMGPGEYVIDRPGGDPPGHFGLAVKDYTHSTAPNRRYPDLVTGRLVKAALSARPSPYSLDELDRLATHCTAQEDAVNKVERQVRKSAAALVVQARVGQTFEAIVTGASVKGTFVRVVDPPIEGKLVGGHRPIGDGGLDVGDRMTVRLTHVDVERGFIDFVESGHQG